MLTLRLQRHGKKHQPSYRLVVAPGRSKLIAPPTEDLGSYEPRTKKANFKAERVQYWLSVGAQASDTVHNLLVREGVLNAPKRKIQMAKAVPKAEPVAEAAPAAEEPKVEEGNVEEAVASEPAEAPAEESAS